MYRPARRPRGIRVNSPRSRASGERDQALLKSRFMAMTAKTSAAAARPTSHNCF